MTVFKQNGFTKSNQQATNQPTLSILILNLMPNKLETENQLTKLFAELSISTSLTFIHPQSHHWKNGDQAELKQKYLSLPEIENCTFDGLLVTGAPLEQLPFSQVDFWEEFQRIRTWSKTHTRQQFFTCWAAQAALYLDYQVPKITLVEKIFGIYQNQLSSTQLPRNFQMPQSRYSKVDRQIIKQVPKLQVLADNEVTGPFVLKDPTNFYILGHPEYDAETLVNEYFRDKNNNKLIAKPSNISLTNPKGNYLTWHNCSRYLYQTWLEQIEENNYDRKQLQI